MALENQDVKIVVSYSAQVFKFIEILVFLGLNQTNCTKADLRMPAKNDNIYNTSVNLSCSVFMHGFFVRPLKDFCILLHWNLLILCDDHHGCTSPEKNVFF
jgi:hypothetical protein